MDSRERVRTALTCGQPDRVPSAGFFSQPIPDIAPVEAEDYFDMDVRFVRLEPPSNEAGFLRYLARLPEDVYIGNLAQLRTYDRWGYHPELGPDGPLSEARVPEDIKASVVPHLVSSDQYRSLAVQVEAWYRQGLAVAGASPHLGR